MSQIKVFLISGALAGLVGMQQILADDGYLAQSYEALLGFTGIAVAFLGAEQPDRDHLRRVPLGDARAR